MKNNIELVQYCENALKNGWYYGWGAWGQKASDSLVESLISQYPTINMKYRSYMQKAVKLSNNLCDCYGLVKGYLFMDKGNKMVYNPSFDKSSGTAFSNAVEKGTLDTLPEVSGIILHMSGHVGVYLGNGRFVECAGGGVGMSEGFIKDGKIIKGSRFINWFKDINVEYLKTEPKPTITPESKHEITVIFDNQEVQLTGELKSNGYNEVNLREVCELLGYLVEYNPDTKTPIVSKI